MTSTQVWMLVAAVALVGVAGLFSASATALSRMTLPRARKLADEGRRRAGPLVALMQDPVRTLNLLALLELATQVTAAALVTVVVVAELQTGPGVALAAIGTTVVLFVVSEVALRTVAIQRTDAVACSVAPLLLRLSRLTAPIVRLLIAAGNVVAPGRGLASGPFVTEDELRDMIDVAGSDEVIEESERAMIHSIFELGDTVAREIMTPRPDMVTVSTDDELSTVVDVVLEAGHSRLPVVERERDVIVGLIYAKDVLARLHRTGSEAGSWHDLLRPAHFVPELVRTDKLLADLQGQAVHMAIVVDEYGATAGLVTIEDVLEEIVGEITDEYDTSSPLVVELEAGRWHVDARMPVEDLTELVNCDLPDEQWDTVGGLLMGTLGHVPSVGEDIEVAGVRLVAERINGRRIAQVRVEVDAAVPDGQGGGPEGGQPAPGPDADSAVGADGRSPP